MSTNTAPGMWAASYSARASRPEAGRNQLASSTTRSGAPSSASSHAVETRESMPAPWRPPPPLSSDPASAAADEGANVARQLRAVLVADVHHVAGMVIMELDAVGREAGAAQRIFRAEQGRREIVIAGADEHLEAGIL